MAGTDNIIRTAKMVYWKYWNSFREQKKKRVDRLRITEKQRDETMQLHGNQWTISLWDSSGTFFGKIDELNILKRKKCKILQK